MMRNLQELNNKYHGWYPTYRGKFLLLRNRVISKEAFILYEASVAFADWDKEHKNYGLLTLSQSEMENQLGFSKGFVSRYGKDLINKGFWKRQDNGSVQIIGFELIESKLLKEIVKKNKVVDLQKYIAETQQAVANNGGVQSKEIAGILPQSVADLQPNNAKYLVSSKGKYFIPRDEQEYQKIYEESNCEGLSPEDMKYIDESIFNSTGINPK